MLHFSDTWSWWQYLQVVVAFIVIAYTVLLCYFHRYWVRFLLGRDAELDKAAQI